VNRSDNERSSASHRLAVIGAAVLFSTGGAGIKWCSLGGWHVAGLRSLVAAVVLALVVPNARRGWTRATAGIGLAYAATLVLFVLGNKLTTSANTIFLQSAAPLYLLLMAPLLLGERISRRDLVLMAFIAVGLGCFFVDPQGASRTAPSPFLGNLLAVGSGITWAITLAGLRWLGRRDGGSDEAMRSVVAGNSIATVLCAAPMLSSGSLAASPLDWTIVAYLGSIQIGVAYLLLTYGFQRVGALEGSLLILVEPALNPLWSWLLHGERPGALALGGGAIILVSSTLLSQARRI
jgi:drug/metabolite transporter (DMT)-like permease